MFSVLLLSILMAPTVEPEVLKLKAQDVVDLVLRNSDQYKNIEILSREAEVNQLQVEADYDLELNAEWSYEVNRGDSLSGIQNIEDRNITYSAGANKSFITGTRIGLGYERVYQKSELQSFTESLRDSNQVYDALKLRAEQNLLKNAFGISQRAKTQSARINVAKSRIQKMENIEALLIEALELFWTTYIAKEDLRYAILGRDRYQSLVKNIESKLARELAEAGDLARVQAELENKEREVKTYSLLYLNLTQHLASLLKIESTKTIELDIATELPSPPELSPESSSVSRSLQLAQLELERAKLAQRAARWDRLPDLSLFGQMQLTGVGPDGGESFSRVSGSDRPIYEVGVNFTFDIFSRRSRAQDLSAEIIYNRAINDLSLARSGSSDERLIAFRSVQSKYVIAQSASKTFDARERVIKDQESRYRRGLIGLSDLIQDFNDYYAAQSARSSAIADYYMARMEWEAANDKLVN